MPSMSSCARVIRDVGSNTTGLELHRRWYCPPPTLHTLHPSAPALARTRGRGLGDVAKYVKLRSRNPARWFQNNWSRHSTVGGVPRHPLFGGRCGFRAIAALPGIRMGEAIPGSPAGSRPHLKLEAENRKRRGCVRRPPAPRGSRNMSSDHAPRPLPGSARVTPLRFELLLPSKFQCLGHRPPVHVAPNLGDCPAGGAATAESGTRGIRDVANYANFSQVGNQRSWALRRRWAGCRAR